jgi:hypothetical protein
VLLRARQALFNEPAAIVTPVTSALAAALSLAASIDPAHVVRLLAAAIGVCAVIAAALVTRRLSGSDASGVLVFWILGACTFGAGAELAADLGPRWILDRTLARQWTAHDGTTGMLFLLMGVLCVTGVSAGRRISPGALACFAVAALASPAMLLLGGAAAVMGATVPARFRFFVMTALGTTLTFIAALHGTSDLAFALPFTLALLAGASFALAASCLRVPVRRRVQTAAVGVLVVTTMALLPRHAGALYLEHEVTARKALEISSAFDRGRWQIVAPLEQLAQTYGRGWFEEPAAFVARHAHRAGDPAFEFDAAVDDLFVFVERRPFKTFSTEASYVPFSALTDPSYRHYRSLAGRASLQAQLRTLCESYARTHQGASIYYQDEQITIYRFRPRR